MKGMMLTVCLLVGLSVLFSCQAYVVIDIPRLLKRIEKDKQFSLWSNVKNALQQTHQWLAASNDRDTINSQDNATANQIVRRTSNQDQLFAKHLAQEMAPVPSACQTIQVADGLNDPCGVQKTLASLMRAHPKKGEPSAFTQDAMTTSTTQPSLVSARTLLLLGPLSLTPDEVTHQKRVIDLLTHFVPTMGAAPSKATIATQAKTVNQWHAMTTEQATRIPLATIIAKLTATPSGNSEMGSLVAYGDRFTGENGIGGVQAVNHTIAPSASVARVERQQALDLAYRIKLQVAYYKAQRQRNMLLALRVLHDNTKRGEHYE